MFDDKKKKNNGNHLVLKKISEANVYNSDKCFKRNKVYISNLQVQDNLYNTKTHKALHNKTKHPLLTSIKDKNNTNKNKTTENSLSITLLSKKFPSNNFLGNPNTPTTNITKYENSRKIKKININKTPACKNDNRYLNGNTSDTSPYTQSTFNYRNTTTSKEFKLDTNNKTINPPKANVDKSLYKIKINLNNNLKYVKIKKSNSSQKRNTNTSTKNGVINKSLEKKTVNKLHNVGSPIRKISRKPKSELNPTTLNSISISQKIKDFKRPAKNDTYNSISTKNSSNPMVHKEEANIYNTDNTPKKRNKNRILSYAHFRPVVKENNESVNTSLSVKPSEQVKIFLKKSAKKESKKLKNGNKIYKNMAKSLVDIHSSIKEKFIKEMNKNPITKSIQAIDYICKAGFQSLSVNKINQDNYFIYKNFLDDKNFFYFGVCDGHGLCGQDASNYLVHNLPFNVNNILKSTQTDLENIKYIQILPSIIASFLQTDLALNENVDTEYSGSTCVSIIFSPSRIFTVNLGDSRAVLGKCVDNKFISQNLSRDHKPTETDERQRIINFNGKIEPFTDEKGDYVGPERVWLPDEDLPGLAMSRSFGDQVAHSVGVIASPEVFDYKFCEEDKFIILASDGIWEFISSQEAVEIIGEYFERNDVCGGVKMLYDTAVGRWMKNEQVIDDITAIVIFLE